MPVQHRPELHVTAETGVLNAPAGVLIDGTSWHVFYQFQPKVDSPRRWGHVTSDDGPFEWQECDDVLAPVGGETHLRAGSVIANGAGADLFFTSVTAAGTKIQLANLDLLEDLCEVSDDPSALDAAVTRVGVVISDQGEIKNFRSPCVVRGWEIDDDRFAGHEGFIMLAVTGEMDSPKPVVLTSPDNREWKLLGSLKFDGDHQIPAEARVVSPRIFRLKDEVDGCIYDVLLLNLELSGRDVSGYLIGTLNGRVFEVKTGFTRIDDGYDFTRPRSATYTPGTVSEEHLYERAVIFGLMNGVGREDDPSTHLSLKRSDWANALSLPRALTLQDGKIYQTPYPGVLDAVAASARARSWIGVGHIPEGSSVTVAIVDAHDDVAFQVTHNSDNLVIDRSMNPHHAGDEPITVLLSKEDSDTLSIIIDGSTVEVFADGGQVAAASRVYIDGGDPTFRVETEGEAVIEQCFEHSSSTLHSELLSDLEFLEGPEGPLLAEEEN